MIAVALVLVMILGVAQVFQMTSQTVSSGQALAALTRDARAAETTMATDIQSMVAGFDQPAMMLWSQRVYAFLNENEAAADLDDDPRTLEDYDATGGPQTQTIPPAHYGRRNHRVDVFSFFANGYYRRQTGGTAGQLVSDDVSTDAWISYGHLAVPQSGSFALAPPQGYASNWILGRTVILLQVPPPVTAPAERARYRGFIAGDLGIDSLDPLKPTSPAYHTLDADRVPDVELRHSHYDLAATSIEDYRGRIANNIASSGDWYSRALLMRFEADPAPPPAAGGIGYDPVAIARTTPIFLRNCTGFAVEFAGDYVRQVDKAAYPSEPQRWGNATSVYTHPFGTDGEIDFYYEPYGQPDGVKKIRWYGLPRDANNDGAINYYDVLPLEVIWKEACDSLGRLNPQENPYGVPPDEPPFERNPGTVFPDATKPENLITGGQTPPNLGWLDPQNGLRPTDAYFCAWGPEDRKPSLIRITLFMHDPNNRLPEGQVFQYVLKVP